MSTTRGPDGEEVKGLTIVDGVFFLHFVYGIVAALYGNLAGVMWCLGIVALIEWDTHRP